MAKSRRLPPVHPGEVLRSRRRHARSSRPDQTGRASARGCVGSRADRIVPCRRSSAATCRLDGGDVDLLIAIIAANARLASPPPAAIASVSAQGGICQERPQRTPTANRR
jgi:hypothetical protein